MDLQRIQLEVGFVEARAVDCICGKAVYGTDEALGLVRILAQQLGQTVHELKQQTDVNAHLIRVVDRLEWRLAALEASLETLQKGVVPS